MRAGRYDQPAMNADPDVHGHMLTPAYDELLLAAIEAGLARRGGDVNRQREVWDRIAPQLVAPGIDLLSIEPLEELLIAAARNRETERVNDVISNWRSSSHRSGVRPCGAQVIRLATAGRSRSLADNAGDAAAVVAEIAAEPTETIRHRAQADAGMEWISRPPPIRCRVGHRRRESQLHEVGLRWEAAQLTGQAALDQTDRSAEALLLRKAREHARSESHPERAAPSSGRDQRRPVAAPGRDFPAI